MNKKVFLLLAILALPFSVKAQSLQDQINAVDAAVTRQQADEAVEQAKVQKRQQAEKAARDQERKRRQDRENKVQDMQVESMSLDLDAKRARASRTNEFIDQELKRQAAETDAIRNVSTGISENLKSTGRAAEIKAKK